MYTGGSLFSTIDGTLLRGVGIGLKNKSDAPLNRLTESDCCQAGYGESLHSVSSRVVDV